MSANEIIVTDEEWEEFKKTHSKSYKDEAEEQLRRGIYLDAKKRITEHNEKYKEGKVSYSMGINHFADLTPEEAKARNRGYGPPRN